MSLLQGTKYQKHRISLQRTRVFFHLFFLAKNKFQKKICQNSAKKQIIINSASEILHVYSTYFLSCTYIFYSVSLELIQPKHCGSISVSLTFHQGRHGQQSVLLYPSRLAGRAEHPQEGTHHLVRYTGGILWGHLPQNTLERDQYHQLLTHLTMPFYNWF